MDTAGDWALDDPAGACVVHVDPVAEWEDRMKRFAVSSP
jgi:hypothetical protein